MLLNIKHKTGSLVSQFLKCELEKLENLIKFKLKI